MEALELTNRAVWAKVNVMFENIDKKTRQDTD
jgi:hypothetical protein